MQENSAWCINEVKMRPNYGETYKEGRSGVAGQVQKW